MPPLPEAEPEIPQHDARFLTALMAVGVAGSLLALGAGFTYGTRVAVSVGVGACIAASNLYVLSRIVHAMVAASSGQGGSAGAMGVLAFGKMAILFGGIWILMTRGYVDPIGLLVGYGSLPIGIAFGSIVSDKTAQGG